MSEPLILKRASASRPSSQWSDEHYDVLADGKVAGRIIEEDEAGTSILLKAFAIHASYRGRHRKTWRARQRESACALGLQKGQNVATCNTGHPASTQ
jgi:hypothetical protein